MFGKNKKCPTGRVGRALRKSASACLLGPRRFTNSPVEAGVLTYEYYSRVAETLIHSCGTVPDFTVKRTELRGGVTGLHLYALASGLAGRLNTVPLVRIKVIVAMPARKVKREYNSANITDDCPTPGILCESPSASSGRSDAARVLSCQCLSQIVSFCPKNDLSFRMQNEPRIRRFRRAKEMNQVAKCSARVVALR
jgi:hypothetical protein